MSSFCSMCVCAWVWHTCLWKTWTEVSHCHQWHVSLLFIMLSIAHSRPVGHLGARPVASTGPAFPISSFTARPALQRCLGVSARSDAARLALLKTWWLLLLKYEMSPEVCVVVLTVLLWETQSLHGGWRSLKMVTCPLLAVCFPLRC